jgi:hypothetical protein
LIKKSSILLAKDIKTAQKESALLLRRFFSGFGDYVKHSRY